MILQSPFTLTISPNPDPAIFSKNAWLVILHATRIPPHIGILIDGSYNSLTIKGHELDVSILALLKTIQNKKIQTLFIPLKKHPVFSFDYQKEIYQFYIKQFNQVKANEASCLSPVKLFLQEFYALPLNSRELLFELIERLKQNGYISDASSINMDGFHEGEFSLPIYSHEQLQEVIHNERAAYYKD